MKIATLDHGGPDGRLVVVSQDLRTYRRCTDDTLQEALDSQRLVPEFEDSGVGWRLGRAAAALATTEYTEGTEIFPTPSRSRTL